MGSLCSFEVKCIVCSWEGPVQVHKTARAGLAKMVEIWLLDAAARLTACHPVGTCITQVRLDSLAKEAPQLTFPLFRMPMLPKKMGTPELVPLSPA